MPLSIPAPSVQVPIETLTQQSFGAFGTVFGNPACASSNSNSGPQNLKYILANQGTALKYPNITQLTNFYDRSRSQKPSKPAITLFVCKPRILRPVQTASSTAQAFNVDTLERHPFTSQTFIPLGVPPSSSPSSTSKASQYLVIVAPSLPSTIRSKAREALAPYPNEKPKSTRARSIRDMFRSARPEPFTNSASGPDGLSMNAELHAVHRQPVSSGMPDLTKLKAFIARGDQAVTYAAGVWHAPMAVLGIDEVPFVVVQNVSGVAEEDCQEVELSADVGRGIVVVVEDEKDDQVLKAKL
ncbi:MAG: Ureidoglycolate lyase [Bogoriella megaspora]|nr:MAG: Ureidoglycolate lyase [Bogoriella megaspora]